VKHIFSLSAAILFSASIAAGSAAAESQSEPGETGQWRVVVKTTHAASLYASMGGLDSYPVAGGLEDCRRIATVNGESFPLDKRATVSTFCLNAATGMMTKIGSWRG